MASHEQLRSELARRLRHPENLGIRFHTFRVGPEHILAVFIQGLAHEERVRLWVLEPMKHLPAAGALESGTLAEHFAAPYTRTVQSLDQAIDGILDGDTAVFLNGAALLIETAVRPGGAGPAAGVAESFGQGLIENVAAVRRRLRTPEFIAAALAAPGETGKAALLYVEGRAEQQLIGQVRSWAEQRAGEEQVRRGLAAGRAARIGLLPTLASVPWPGKTAVLLDAGYVAVLVDGIAEALVAPVTAPMLLQGPGDEHQRRALAGIKRFLRVLLAFVVILAPGMIVAVLEYHQEMIPTTFLLALASVRETATLPIVMVMAGLEVLQQLFWTVPFRLQFNISAGQMLITFLLTVTFLTFVGLTGPLTAVSAVLGFIGTLNVVSYDLRNLVQAWRWAGLAGAALFGLFGIATVIFLLAVYLTQHESFGVPFIGETGTRFTVSRRSSAQRERGNAYGSPPSSG
ncbi:MAG TPA: spore germination protein [Symbiobacteriaceae bacterium]|nr:spore germination protein [Symbiobacteriaceae bacterium]